VWAYTAQFGGGFSGTISSEARRTTQIINENFASGAAASGTVTPGGYVSAVAGGGALFPGNGAYGGMQTTDFVANLRVDQAWGGAQIMGAAHEVNANYYGIPLGAVGPSTPGTGHPSDRWGWAAGVGIKINTPFITQGDWFQAQFNVTEGALRYVFNTPNSNWGKVDGANETFGVLSDCVYGGTVVAGTGTSCQLTSAWGFNAGYEHYWTPAWHTSLYGAWAQVKYDGQANAMLCQLEGNGTGGIGAGSAAVAGAGCSNNWSQWGVGSRTQWDVTKTFYLGVEVLYSQMQSASLTPTGTLINAAGVASPVAFGSAIRQESSSSNWMVSIRAHRDFLP